MGKKRGITVKFLGNSGDGVTGSMVLVTRGKTSILLDCGLYQDANPIDEYIENARPLGIPRKLDYAIVSHLHADHSMLVPRLFADGYTPRVIVPERTKRVFRLLGRNSAFILARNKRIIETQKKKKIKDIYTTKDVTKVLDAMEEYKLGDMIELEEGVKVRFRGAGHIRSSAQVELYLLDGVNWRKVVYSGDLGNTKLPSQYVEPFETVENGDIFIGESTYGDRIKTVGEKVRKKDREKILHTVRETPGIVLIPAFALSRTLEVLTEMYEMREELGNIKVCVDSALAAEVLYAEKDEAISEEMREKVAEVLKWNRLTVLKEGADSKEYLRTLKKGVVISASGMLSQGRSKTWLKKIIGGEGNRILFVGYASENTLGGIIKEGKKKEIKIDSELYPIKCGISELHSFTSHMQYPELVKYYGSINTPKIYLHHGDTVAKEKLKQGVLEEASKNNRCPQVYVAQKGMEIRI